ncbi:hypothetical protein IFM89_016724 [Coptis chinensis]|uniref:Uncharacterized protein n=1 Tax=Coptis chinensis TaxID=261450 RepID=A0A835ILM3_9MAGN|nr:hypothetical protein IFM89_016724 [Coptis chinensis]
MRVFGKSALFLVVGISFILLAFTTATTSSPDTVFYSSGASEMAILHNRKLKEKGYYPSIGNNRKNGQDVNLEDYLPVDPVPSSRTSITNGPIEHGAPLMPYIPKPTPSAPPKPGGP